MFINIPGRNFGTKVHLGNAALNNSGSWFVPLRGGGSHLPQKRLSMRKIKDVLRLRFGMNLGQDQIARSCSISQATVHRYLERAESGGLSWPPPVVRPGRWPAAMHRRRRNRLVGATDPGDPRSHARPDG